MMTKRDEFEKWAKSELYPTRGSDDWRFCLGAHGEYRHPVTRAALMAWQAACKSQEWRPIETAPKYGKIWGISIKGGSADKWHWDSNRKDPMWRRYFRGVMDDKNSQPTHWMPLPQPPQETK